MEDRRYIPPVGGEFNAQYEHSTEPQNDGDDAIKEHFPRLAEALANNKASVADSGSDYIEDPELKNNIIEAIKTVYDPEIPVNIYELGLIYEVNIKANGNVDVLMTLTSPGCPAAGMLPGDVEEKVRSVDKVSEVKVEVTFEPPWDQSMMTDEAKLELGFM
jgi:FeS assembly SUF system protein